MTLSSKGEEAIDAGTLLGYTAQRGHMAPASASSRLFFLFLESVAASKNVGERQQWG